MTENLMTVSQAAQMKGVTRSVIYKAIQRGDLRVEIVLGRQAVYREEIRTWEPRKAGRHRGTPASEEVKTRISETQKIRWRKRKQKEN